MKSNFQNNRIGVMQGRLSPIRNGRIQSFPLENWRNEVAEVAQINIQKIEWTIDSEEFSSNPLVRSSGVNEINSSINEWKITVPSVTCDYFMENPPWLDSEDTVQANLKSIINGMHQIDSEILVIPLVDNSSIKDSSYTSYVMDYFKELEQYLVDSNVRVAFETDLPPDEVCLFIENFSPSRFGINYDIGNSASLGFNPLEEFDSYGQRIINVHVKDRILNGTTVPLGEGNADFELVFELLVGSGYKGNYILQTARASDGNHAARIVKYSNQVIGWLEDRS
jgi:hexulose-6-phosphate isomerase